jgi:hypothetical protein
MKSTIPFVALLIVFALCGCGTVGEKYVSQHPELSPEHQAILKTGKVPDGTAIAGMTREQVQLAMGIDPTQYTKIDGQDAWVYVRKRLAASSLSTSVPELDRRDSRNRSDLPEDRPSSQDQGFIKTTIFFQGEVATRAEVVNGGL